MFRFYGSLIMAGLFATLVAMGQAPVKSPTLGESDKLETPSNSSFRLMAIPYGEAHVVVDGQPVRIFMIPKAGDNQEGSRKAVFSRWCTVAPRQNGKPFYELAGDSLSFTVLLPAELPQQQSLEAITKLGIDEKVILLPSDGAGLTIRIINSGQEEEFLIQRPTATSQLPIMLPVSKNVTNKKLLTLLGSKPDQTSVIFEVFARQNAEIRRGFTATRVASATNDICDRLGLPKDARKIAVSIDVQRKFLTELAVFITLVTKDFDKAEALKIVKEFSADWDRCGAVDLEKVKANLVVIGNDTLRHNMKTSEFQNLKRKFSETGATEKISRACWDIVNAAALAASTEVDFKKRVSTSTSSSSECGLSVAALIKSIPVNLDFNNDSSGSSQTVEDMQITIKDFVAIQTYFKNGGSTYESFKKNHHVAWEGKCFAKTFQSNLTDNFSLLEIAKLSTRLEIAVSVAESRGDRFVGFQSAFTKLFKSVHTTSSIAKWDDAVERAEGDRTHFKAQATMELSELPSSGVIIVNAEGSAINPGREVYRVSTVHAVKDMMALLNRPKAGISYAALIQDPDLCTNAAQLTTIVSVEWIPKRKIYLLTFDTDYQSCDNKRTCHMNVAFNIELIPLPKVGKK